MSNNNNVQIDHSALRAVKSGLFPTLDSLEAAINNGMAQLPIETPNQLMSVLMTFQNTLIQQLQDQQNIKG